MRASSRFEFAHHAFDQRSWSSLSRIWKPCGRPRPASGRATGDAPGRERCPPTCRPPVARVCASMRSRISRAALLVKVTASTPQGTRLRPGPDQAIAVHQHPGLARSRTGQHQTLAAGAVTASRCASFSPSNRCETSMSRILSAGASHRWRCPASHGKLSDKRTEPGHDARVDDVSE